MLDEIFGPSHTIGPPQHLMIDGTPTLQSRLVINQCQPQTSLAKEAMEILPEFGIELCRTFMHQRQVYRQSAVFGQTVHDFGSKAASAVAEIEALTDEVLGLIGDQTSAEGTGSR